MSRNVNLGVLVSGAGTNLQAILEAISEKKLSASVRLVVSNKPGVLALERAEKAGVPTKVVSHRDYADREAFDGALVAALVGAGVDWVVLAGFMRLLTRKLLGAFPNRVLNIHPSLLPAFPGVDAQRQAFDYGAKITGCTVHLVDEGTDTGPIVAQRAVPVRDDDDAESLTARILVEEHRLLVEVLAAIAEGRLDVTPGIDGKRTRAHLRSA
ncbi:MAG TPA: phosphoribosylglycinamide formyltransferase [Polyangiaceae bacterium]|jgi:phosphoribosylglycinamide formyltransferase-1|nr:phosphoribosylglycinamide formyltransferase [Polyangiaceae bacterium]